MRDDPLICSLSTCKIYTSLERYIYINKIKPSLLPSQQNSRPLRPEAGLEVVLMQVVLVPEVLVTVDVAGEAAEHEH